jgi:hypothetical protein
MNRKPNIIERLIEVKDNRGRYERENNTRGKDKRE